MGDVSGPVEGFELRFQLFHGTTMRVGYQYRVGSVSTLYRCSPVEVYAGVYLPEFLFRLLGYPLFLVVVEYTGLEYVAGKFRVTAGALADVHHGTWLHSTVALFKSDTFVEVLAGVTAVEVFTTGFGCQKSGTGGVDGNRCGDFLQHPLTHHADAGHSISVAFCLNHCIHNRRTTHQRDVLFRFHNAVNDLRK